MAYNSEKEVVFLSVDLQKDSYGFIFLKNPEHLTNEEIERDLHKKLSVKDSLEVSYRKSFLNREFKPDFDRVFAGRIWRQNELDLENNQQHIQIMEAILSSLTTGEIKTAPEMRNRYCFLNCSIAEVGTICDKLKELEAQHKEENKSQESGFEPEA